jgi:uncharacterized protein YgbK (DUF1537 family)
VLERVAATGLKHRGTLSLRSTGEPLPDRGIVVGEAESAADLVAWGAIGVGQGVLAAGASEFFGAFLRALGHSPAERSLENGHGSQTCDLFVCGSTSAGSRRFCRQSESRGVPVLRLPGELLERSVSVRDAEAWIERWADQVAGALSTHPRVVAAIDRPLCSEPGMPQVLGGYLSAVVAQVLTRVTVDRLFAEGGATAVALVRRMGWTCMSVRREWATGVVTLAVEGQDAPLMSMKPGSYVWPEAILES